MSRVDRCTRRRFLELTGAAATFAASGSVGVAGEGKSSPDEVLASLLEGNERFVRGKLKHPRRTPKDFVPLAEGQMPVAAIVGCADSRVGPELVFDQGVGDLFVVRVAGNVVTATGDLLKGSLEFAVAELKVRLILVLGHTRCGAVRAAIEHIESSHELPGSIGGLVRFIQPAVAATRGEPGDKLENVTRANVQRCVTTLSQLEPILANSVRKKEIKVVGGVYDLATGRVNLVK